MSLKRHHTDSRAGLTPTDKFRKRPWRYLPLAASIIFSGILLGGCVNFMVECVLRSASDKLDRAKDVECWCGKAAKR